jgi:DNA-binding GntR family transcriptional regulator
MFDEKKKNGLAILIASKMKDKDEKEDGGNDSVEMASDILDAIEAKDAKALAKLLKSFVQLCGE